MTKVYSVKPADFAAQMKALSAAGIILFCQRNYDYLLHDGPLPSKP
jgi:hypothetical protein